MVESHPNAPPQFLSLRERPGRRAGILRRAVDGVVLLVEAAEEVVAAVQAIVAAGDVGAERVLDRRGEAEVVDVAGIPPVLVRRREVPEVAHRRGVRPDVQRIDPGQLRRGEAVRAGRHAVRAGHALDAAARAGRGRRALVDQDAVAQRVGRHGAGDDRLTALVQAFEVAEEEQLVLADRAANRAAEDVLVELGGLALVALPRAATA